MFKENGNDMEFNYRKLDELVKMLKEAQFVPPDAMGGAGGGMPPDAGMMPPPDAGGMPPPDAGGMPPPDAGMMPPPDAGGMPPVDPGMMMPPAGDPMAALGGMPQPDAGDVSPSGEPYMKITPTQLSKLFKQFAEVFKSVLGIGGQQPGGQAVAQAQPPAPDPAMAQKINEINAKLDAYLGVAG